MSHKDIAIRQHAQPTLPKTLLASTYAMLNDDEQTWRHLANIINSASAHIAVLIASFLHRFVRLRNFCSDFFMTLSQLPD